MNFLRKIANMLRKDKFTVSEPDYSGSDSISSLSEIRASMESFISDLMPVFEDVRFSDNDEIEIKQQELCDGDNK